jgi:hypothetical protein
MNNLQLFLVGVVLLVTIVLTCSLWFDDYEL